MQTMFLTFMSCSLFFQIKHASISRSRTHTHAHMHPVHTRGERASEPRLSIAKETKLHPYIFSNGHAPTMSQSNDTIKTLLWSNPDIILHDAQSLSKIGITELQLKEHCRDMIPSIPDCLTLYSSLSTASSSSSWTLDKLWGSRGDLLEIYGAACTGKTQLCLQLAFESTQLEPASKQNSKNRPRPSLHTPSSLSPTCIYIYSRPTFPISRLYGMAKNNGADVHALDRIQLHKIMELEDLWTLVNSSAFESLLAESVQYVILDSLGDWIRVQQGSEDKAKHAAFLFRLGQKLKQLARLHQLCIIVTNQISDRFALPNEQLIDAATTGEVESDDWQRQYPYHSIDWRIPALNDVRPLGTLSWSYCLKNRVYLSRSSQGQRRAWLMKSTARKPSAIDFIIDAQGVQFHDMANE